MKSAYAIAIGSKAKMNKSYENVFLWTIGSLEQSQYKFGDLSYALCQASYVYQPGQEFLRLSVQQYRLLLCFPVL